MTCRSEGSAERSPDHFALYRRMWVLRLLDMALEELRIDGLLTGPMRAALGQEAVGIGATAVLAEGDIAITTHRPHAQHVGLGSPLGPVIAEMMQPASPPAQDQPPNDGHTRAAGAAERLSACSRVVQQSPLLAIGYAYTQWLDDNGRVTLCVAEDGDVDSVAFNEAANMAVVWQLPVVILVENLRDALSPRLDSHAQDIQLYRRAASYGMPGVSVDGNDVEAVLAGVGRAVQRARTGGGPTLVQAITYRTADFAGSDRGSYCDRGGSEQFLDPLIFARRRLSATGVTRSRLDEVERAARHLVADAVTFAKSAARPGDGGLSQAASNPDGQPENRC